METKNPTTIQPPFRYTIRNVYFWNDVYKALGSTKEGIAIQRKAKHYVQNNCVEFDNDSKLFIVKPLDKEKKLHVIRANPDKSLKCDCSIFEDKGICPHFLAYLLTKQILDSHDDP
jgi:hypothetical protein